MTNVDRTKRFGIACRNLQEFKRKACIKFNVSIIVRRVGEGRNSATAFFLLGIKIFLISFFLFYPTLDFQNAPSSPHGATRRSRLQLAPRRSDAALYRLGQPGRTEETRVTALLWFFFQIPNVTAALRRVTQTWSRPRNQSEFKSLDHILIFFFSYFFFFFFLISLHFLRNNNFYQP